MAALKQWVAHGHRTPGQGESGPMLGVLLELPFPEPRDEDALTAARLPSLQLQGPRVPVPQHEPGRTADGVVQREPRVDILAVVRGDEHE